MELWADSHFVSPADMAGLLRRIETVLAEEAVLTEAAVLAETAGLAETDMPARGGK
jgi:hypothetical protein